MTAIGAKQSLQLRKLKPKRENNTRPLPTFAALTAIGAKRKTAHGAALLKPRLDRSRLRSSIGAGGATDRQPEAGCVRLGVTPCRASSADRRGNNPTAYVFAGSHT